MTLSETLLPKLSEWKPGAGRQILAMPDQGPGWSVTITADRADPLGCLLWEMTLRRSSAPAPSDVEALQAWAVRVARRATGLLEGLLVIEVDAPRMIAMLRSEEPAQRGADLFYYEVLLKGTAEANVRRYHASRQLNQHREQVAFTLTHEAIAKLADDLAAEK